MPSIKRKKVAALKQCTSILITSDRLEKLLMPSRFVKVYPSLIILLSALPIIGVPVHASAITPLPSPLDSCSFCQPAMQLPAIDGIEGFSLSFNFVNPSHPSFDLSVEFFGNRQLTGDNIAPGTVIPFSYNLSAMAIAFLGVNSLDLGTEILTSPGVLGNLHSTVTSTTNCGFSGNFERCVAVTGGGAITFPDGLQSGTTLVEIAEFSALTFPSTGGISEFSGTFDFGCPCTTVPEPRYIPVSLGAAFLIWCHCRKLFSTRSHTWS